MELNDAYTLIASAFDAGTVANGYLVTGDMPRCEMLAEKLVRKIFPSGVVDVKSETTGAVTGYTHPDLVRLDPKGAKRIIPVDLMRDGMIEPMSTTAFAGGWKVGVIAGADRMEAPSANAFLKLLEEPPAKTVFLLLSDTPDAILPTIISRTQRIDLRLSAGLLDKDNAAAIAEAMSAPGLDSVYAKAQVARQLTEIYEDLKEIVENEEGDLSAMRKAFFRTVLNVVRGWLIDAKLPEYKIFHDYTAVEEAHRQVSESMKSDAVLSFMCDRMFFPDGR